MKKSIWISILVVLCITMVVLAGCVQPKPHLCQNKCETCGKCTNENCAETVCADKCQGHKPAHTCESVCPTCNKCLDATCTESACAEKCPGHTTPHSCQNKCETCGKCTNENCTEAVCANKCEGHVPPHACQNKCETCGKCTNENCTETVCADKCQGHKPPHSCQNVCPVCGKCTNEDCAEAICADKCDGHQETGKIQLQLTGASFESIYAEWLPMGNATYNVYCDGNLVDAQLTRNYGSYYRVDIVGITAGEHTVKIVPVFDGTEEETPATTFTKNVTAHVREGFAFVGGQATGAYNMDGTLKADARVLYVTTNNFDTITMDIQVGKSTITPQVGLQNILLALKKGYETKPICVRFIGNIVNPTILQKGDLEVDCSTTKFTGGITLEGIGNDATFNGFGVRLKNCSNVEVRNIGFMNCASEEGDSVSLQQDNHHIWIHNCDFFYGMAGSDADQDKGDGAMDCKKSTNVTFSYNHFWDTGKSNLLGVSGEETTNSITYHHNWYDHSDSRHPRVRTATVHVYNNYFDGNSKYGIGATEGCSIFVENNYFNNCKNPMLISKQGTDAQGDGTFSGDAGGIIKAFGNVIVGGKTPIPYSQNATSFDYFDATSRDQVVPSTVVTVSGGTGYNNFDTANTMYSYNVQSAEDARDNVIAWAGRVQGGDFKWTFTDQDNSSYAVDAELKKALVNYTGKVVLADTPVTPNPNPDGGNTDGDNTGDGDNTDGDNQGGITLTQVSHSFENGIESDYFTINGNTSSSKGSVPYNGVTYTKCLKIESSTSITFTTTETMQLTLVLGGSSNNNIKIDGEKVVGTTNVIVVTLEAGTHTITKADVTNLFYIALDVVE